MMRKLFCIVVGTGTALSLAACGGDSDPLSTDAGSGDSIVVGSANFPENVLLGEIYAGALENEGYDVDRKLNVGSREVLFKQVENCAISVIPEYNQALLSYAAPDVTATGEDEVNAALATELPAGVGILTPSPAADNNAVVVTKETADEYSLTSLADLAAVASDLIMGGPTEFQTRKDGLVGLQDVYDITFDKYTVLGDNSGPITVSALKGGNVDVALMQSSSPQLEDDFVVLTDPESVLGVNNVTPFYCKDGLDAKAQGIIESVASGMTTEELVELNKEYSVERKDASEVASDWLSANDLG